MNGSIPFNRRRRRRRVYRSFDAKTNALNP